MSEQSKLKQTNRTHAKVLSAIRFEELGLGVIETKDLTSDFSTWVRVLSQNWRQGTVACKGRSSVAYSSKKPFKQKGTGRARAGSARSPLWRGGGVAFGPQRRGRKVRIAKRLKKGVLGSLLASYVKNGKLSCLDWQPESEKPRTATACAVLEKANIGSQKITLFLSFGDVLSYASFANLPNVRVLFFDQPNAIDLAQGEHWVILKKDFDLFKDMVSKWI